MTMELKPFIVHPSDQPRPLNVVGEQVVVLAGGEATGGYELFLQRGPEGTGPPPHSHPWDESFYVLQGLVHFGLGDDVHAARAGTLVHVPGGSAHWFRFGAGGGEMVSVTSHLAASRMFREIDRCIAPDAPDLERLIGIGAEHEVAFQG